jgi:type IV fimbrial biogenesis protein FimT
MSKLATQQFKKQANQQANRGYSAIECIIVVAIVAILCSAAAPSFARLLKQSSLSSVRDTWFSALMMARGQAANLRQPIVVCASIDGQRCLRQASANGQLMVYLDRNGNWTRDANEATLLQTRVEGANVSSNRTGVLFRADGAAPGYNQTLRFCLPSNPVGLGIVIANSGRVRMSNTSCPG